VLELIETFNWQDAVDIFIVTVILYQLLKWIRGTRAMMLVRGIAFIFIFYFISSLLNLATIKFLMEKLATLFLIALIIVFQPEIRKALERLGRGNLLGLFLFSSGKQTFGYLNQIIKAVEELSQKKSGAIIVLERSTGLSEFVSTGLKLEALVSQNLLVNIFEKNTPLHDGAVIISGDRIQAAGCVLPLSESELDDRLSTRHRAGLGLSEVSDALVIIVSEETGVISIAENGFLSRYLDRESLEERLLGTYQKENEMRFANFFKHAGDWLNKK